MGTGWRRAFCNTVPRDATAAEAASNPSTPRLRCKTITDKNAVDLVSPMLECKTFPSPRIRNPSSPRSPFSLLKNTLRLSRNSCGVCMRSVKTGQGMAIYTAECSHSFHFPCIASHVRNQASLICPVCSTIWKDVPLLALHTRKKQQQEADKIVQIDSCFTPTKPRPVSSPRFTKLSEFADDEPLVTPKAGVGIPEDDDEEVIEEFRGFFVNPVSSSDGNVRDPTKVVISLGAEAAVISQGTYAVVLKIKAPPPSHAAKRAPIDLVTVLDVSGSMTGAKLEMLKRAMRLVIASLGSSDRLSILVFSAAPRRLLPLRRMTGQGQRLARRIIDRLSCSHGTSMAEALKEATRVLEERRERNPVASIILLSDGVNESSSSSQHCGPIQSTRFTHVEIPAHSTGEPAENAFSKCVAGLLSVVVQDLRIQLGLAPGSDPAEITATYSCNERPTALGSGCIRVGDLYAEEEKELLVEIRVPTSGVGSHHVIATKCCYKDPATQEVIYGKEQVLLVPRPHPHPHSRLRNVFISSRAVAESRRLIEHNQVSCAMQLLTSARALLMQSRSELSEESIRSVEVELAELQWRKQRDMGLLTPTSASRSSQKQLLLHRNNRVDDLHGFENARF